MSELDPAFLRGMTQRRYSRRDAFRLGGLSAVGLALAACGVKGKKVAAANKDSVAKYWAGKTKHGHVDFANWPLYIDPKHPQLKEFTAQTGISVNYQEVIQDDPSWFAKIQPLLAAGKSINYDLMVVTDGIQFTELVELGYLAPLDHSKMPNFAKYAGSHYKAESFDPGNVYSAPWASGMTGIAYNTKYVKTPPTSILELWDPKYKGKVGMMSDPEELGNFGMFATGTNPETSTPADWAKAGAKLKAQRDAGLVRKYYEQDYIKALSSGDVWITMGWSGDVFQQNLSEHTELKFAIPQEGATIWTDNMMVPKTAANPVDAITLLDFFYEPSVAGSLTEYINYVTPVPAAQQSIMADAAKANASDKASFQQVANSALVFPSEADYAKLKHYRAFKNEQEKQQYLSIFEPITQS